jgi:cobaltochelatase CobT
MSIPNTGKGKAAEPPAEPFKRAIAGCVRAIAGRAELDVAFAAEKPALTPDRVRLPEPPRRMTKQDAAILRGHADSMALRLAVHSPTIHKRMLPQGGEARAVFEAVEQARVEAIGARRMDGVAANLTAMLEDRFHKNFADVSERADAPLEDALAMMVRERLTGMEPPPAARKLVDLWREYVESRSTRELNRLADEIDDQRGFAEAMHDLLTSLDMGEEQFSDREEDDDQDEDDENPDQSDEQNAADSQESEDGSSPEDSKLAADDTSETTTDSDEAPSSDRP